MTMKVFLNIVCFIILTVVQFGFIAPTLISAPRTELVILGFMSIIVHSLLVLLYVIRIVKSIKTKLKN